MMKWSLGALIFTNVLVFGNQKAPDWDADLFRKNEAVFSAHLSFLYWRAQEGSLDYAIKMTQPAPGGSSYAQGKMHKATFDGDPGFRVALSYFRAPKEWEVWGQYTRITSRGSNHVQSPSTADRYLNGTWPEIIATPLTRATSSIHLNYNVADLLVDRYFIPNPHLRIRMLGGGTTAWINQNWIVRYLNEENASTQIRNQWNFIGGGFKAGSFVDWFWTSDIYLTSSVSLTSVIGSYKNRVKQTASNSTTAFRNLRFDDVRSAFSIQFIFGPSWQKSFCSTRWEIFAGYELNSWFNLQEIYRSTASTAQGAKETWLNTGTLTLQGLTARVTGDF